MAKDEEQFESEEYKDFVPAVFARTAEEAEYYRELLSDHEIPAVVGADDQDKSEGAKFVHHGMSRGMPVLVPEVFLDEASEIIADREDLDEFEPEKEEEEDQEDEELGLGQEELGVEQLQEEQDEEESDEDEDKDQQEDSGGDEDDDYLDEAEPDEQEDSEDDEGRDNDEDKK